MNAHETTNDDDNGGGGGELSERNRKIYQNMMYYSVYETIVISQSASQFLLNCAVV